MQLMTQDNNQPRIAIAGGGPGALTLGALLHQRNIPFTIYELRPRPTAADLDEPSGMLDLHEDSGLAAVRACGLFDQFLPFTAECEESMIVADQDGNVLHADQGGSGSGDRAEYHRPEISRHNITRLMLSVLPEGVVQYETKVVVAAAAASAARRSKAGEEAGGDEVVLLELEHGGRTTEEKFDLVVGADGAWSRIRPLLSEARPQMSGLHYITLIIRDVTKQYPVLAARVGKGSYMALGNRHGVFSMRGAQDSAMVRLFISDTQMGVEAVTKMADLPISEVRERLLGDERLFGAFGDKVKELLRVAFDEEVKAKGAGCSLEVKPLVMLPVGHRWEHTPGVTLVGDAAHVMLPTAGEGVNQAMWDALKLSEAIVKAWEQSRDPQSKKSFQATLSPLVRAFEEEMIARAQAFSEESCVNAEMMFSEEGAKGMANFMAEAYMNVPVQQSKCTSPQ